MALTPQSNEAFLREVDDELRRDQALAFWRRYGRWLVIGVIVALAAFAAWLFWREHRREVAEADGAKLQAAYDAWGANRSADADKAFAALAASDIEGYRVSAIFSQAEMLLNRKDAKGAVAKFAQVAGDTSVAQPFRDLALVRQTTVEFDALKPDVVVARLKPLAAPGNPWFGSAGELVAAAYLRQGNRALAGQLFAKMAQDEDVPTSIRQRATDMAGALGVDAAASKSGGEQAK